MTTELEARNPDEVGVGLIARIVRRVQLQPEYRPDYAIGPSQRRETRRAG